MALSLRNRAQDAVERFSRRIGERAASAVVTTGSRARTVARFVAGGAGSTAAAALDGWGESIEKARRSGLFDETDDEPGAGGRGRARNAKDGTPQGLSGVPSEIAGQLFDSDTAPYAQPQTLSTPGPMNRLSYDEIRLLAMHPVISPILWTRINEVRRFAVVQRDEHSIGYEVRIRDKKRTATAAERRKCQEAEKFIGRCGNWSDSDIQTRYMFGDFLAMLTHDALRFDQGCAQILYDMKDEKPAAFLSMPSHQIRRAVPRAVRAPMGLEAFFGATNLGGTPENPDFVQVDKRLTVVGAWPARKLLFGVRRPRSDAESYGYGWPELDELIKVLRALLDSMDYNMAQFHQGILTNGMLKVRAKYTQEQFKMFKRQLRAMMVGVRNAHRVPYLQVNPDEKEDIEWLDFKKSNKDQEFSQWMGFLLKVACAVYMMDPAQINFIYGTEGVKSALSQGSGENTRVLLSQDRGLWPLLSAIAEWVNKWIIWPMDPSLHFAFVGMDAKTPEEKLRIRKLRLETTDTVDELRAEDDKAPMPDGTGDCILSPTWIQYAAQKAAAAGGGEGAPGAPGDEGEPGAAPDDDGGEDDAFPGLSFMDASAGKKGSAAPDANDEGDDEQGAPEKPGKDPKKGKAKAEPEGFKKAAPVPSWQRGERGRNLRFYTSEIAPVDDGDGEG